MSTLQVIWFFLIGVLLVSGSLRPTVIVAQQAVRASGFGCPGRGSRQRRAALGSGQSKKSRTAEIT